MVFATRQALFYVPGTALILRVKVRLRVFSARYSEPQAGIRWNGRQREEKGCPMALFCFSLPKNSRFVTLGEKQKIFMV